MTRLVVGFCLALGFFMNEGGAWRLQADAQTFQHQLHSDALAIGASTVQQTINDRISQTCVSVADLGGGPSATAAQNAVAFRGAYLEAGQTGKGCVKIPGAATGYLLDPIVLSEFNDVVFACEGIGGTPAGGAKIIAAGLRDTTITVQAVGGITFSGCAFGSVAQQTGGSYLKIVSSNTFACDRCSFNRGYDPVVLQDSALVYMLNVSIRNTAHIAATHTGLIGGPNGGTHDVYWLHPVFDQDDQSNPGVVAGLYADQMGGSMEIVGGDILHQHNNLWLNPGANQFAIWTYGSLLTLDSADFPDIAIKGSIAGTTLNVTAADAPMLTIGQFVAGDGVAANTRITGVVEGNGGVGSYTISPAQTVPPGSFAAFAAHDGVDYKITPHNGGIANGNVCSNCWASTASPAIQVQGDKTTINGAIAGSTLTVTGARAATLAPGQTITGPGVVAGTTIAAFGTGTGGTGTYTIAPTQTVPDTTMTLSATTACDDNQFVQLQSLHNYGASVVIGGGCDKTEIVSPIIHGASIAAPGSQSAVSILGDALDVSIIGGFIGAGQGYAATQKFNLAVASGYKGTLVVAGVNLRAPRGSGLVAPVFISSEATPAPGSSIATSPGFNNMPTQALALPPSGSIYTASLAPEEIHIATGASSSARVLVGAFVICNVGANAVCAARVGPLTTVTIVYAGSVKASRTVE